MENFIKQLDSLSENDPFALMDRNFFNENDLELIEKHRLKVAEDRRRIRDERRTKTFEQIMNELVKELAQRPMVNANRSEGEPIELDTSNDEQDDLEHFTALIDPSQSIGHSVEVDPLKSSTYVLFPSSRPLKNYADQGRRNTYTLDEEDSSSSSSVEQKGQRPNYVRLVSEGFDPQQSHHGFDNVKDARSTFSIPKGNSRRLTEQQARRILQEKLPAFIKGHLTRQLFRTEHVKGLIRTLHDTRKFAVQFQNESLQKKTKLDTQDFQIIDQLIDQAAAVLNEIQAIFFQYPASRRILMILRNEQTQALRLARNRQRILKDASHEVIQRPMIDPVVVPATNQLPARPTQKTQSDYPGTKAVLRRHVTSVSSTANTHTTRPLKKTISVQRQSRPSASNNVASTNPPRSSSANTAIRPPLRLAPASPLFRNRLK